MTVVSLRINGYDYQVACDDGQEEHLRALADEVDDRIRSLTFNMNNKPSEQMALLLAALMMADELAESKQEYEKPQLPDPQVQMDHENRMAEMEVAMASTLEEIAVRIEKIAEQIEVR